MYIPPGGISQEVNMQRTKTAQEKILHRYQIAKGHLAKVIKMIESDEYCLDIVHQSIAVQAALKEADRKILENHLKTCTANDIKKGKGDAAVEEIMNVLKKM